MSMAVPMTLRTLTVTPWRAMRGSGRWTLAFAVLACTTTAILLRFLGPAPDAWQAAIAVYGFGAGFMALMLSALLPFALDARRLRLPGIERAAVASLLAWAIIVVLLPLLLLAPAAGQAATMVALTAVIFAGVLTFALLPRYAAIPLCLGPMFGPRLWQAAALPTPGEAGFMTVATGFLTVLVLLDVLCWRRMLVRGSDTTGLGRPVAVMMHRQARGGFGRALDGDFIRQRPGWLQVEADLRGVGPAAPARALRIALGAGYLPQTWASRGRQALMAVLVWVVFVLPVLYLDSHALKFALKFMSHPGVGLWAVGWVVLMVLMLVGGLLPLTLSQRWVRVNAELPLLALLPGLGDPPLVRRHLLHATLGQPLVILLPVLLAVLLLGWMGDVGTTGMLLLVLPVLACMVAALDIALCTCGGRLLPGWASLAWLGLAGVLVLASWLLPLLDAALHADILGSATVTAFAAAWLLAGAFLVWLGRRGWRGLARRPHPFLANPP